MKHPEKVKSQAECAREFRGAGMPRSRPNAKPYQFRRRTGPRMPIVLEPVAGDGFARRFWDEHAIKAGMSLFWMWFAVANWTSLGSVLSNF